MYEHPIDRLMYRLRVPIIVLAVLSLPVFLLTYGLMLRYALTTWPWWGGVALVVSHLMGWLGIGSLFDMRQEKHQSSEAAPSPQLPRS